MEKFFKFSEDAKEDIYNSLIGFLASILFLIFVETFSNFVFQISDFFKGFFCCGIYFYIKEIKFYKIK